MRRKTRKMFELERTHKRPIRELVAKACKESSSDEEAAEKLQISRQTLLIWRASLGIRTHEMADPPPW